MRLGFTLCALLGILSGALLVTWHGIAEVAGALRLAGWSGLAAMSFFHLIPLGLCALAWRALFAAPRPSAPSFLWFRWLRDAGGEIFGMVPASGEIISIRTMAARGTELSLAAASTVVDLTAEMCGQIAFSLLGVALLIAERPGDRLIVWTLGGAGTLAVLVGAFAMAQRRGIFRLLERATRRFAADYGWTSLDGLNGIHDRIGEIYRHPGAVLRAIFIHCLAWLVGVGEAAIAFACMGVPVSLSSLLVLESLTFALRSAAFFIPGAAGVQEGGYVLLGAALGIGPEYALALSLLKRGRELVFGVTALAAWYWGEGRQLWHHLRFSARS